MINWGVVGLGRMGNEFVNSIKETNNSQLVLVSSLDKRKLEIFSKNNNFNDEYLFNNYDSLINNDKVNSIYIATTNNTHLDLIKKCIKAKKNILCEKPICLNLKETQEAKKLISDNNIKFVEAIAYYSHPLYIELRKLIDKKEIGDILSIDSLLGFKVKKIDPSSRLFNKKLGGGAILDLGCYPISFLMLFEKDTEKFIIEKKKISYSSTNVDDFAEATINIKDEVKANIKISLKENLQNNCIIKGTKGQIFIPSPWLPEKNSYLEVQSDKRNYKKFFDIDKSVYANQIYNVSKYFNNEDGKNLFTIDFSLKCMNFLDRWID